MLHKYSKLILDKGQDNTLEKKNLTHVVGTTGHLHVK